MKDLKQVITASLVKAHDNKDNVIGAGIIESEDGEIKTVVITMHKNPVQVTNCYANFTVCEQEYDEGRPVGNGSTLLKAIDDFKISWQLKFDEEIKTIISIKAIVNS